MGHLLQRHDAGVKMMKRLSKLKISKRFAFFSKLISTLYYHNIRSCYWAVNNQTDDFRGKCFVVLTTFWRYHYSSFTMWLKLMHLKSLWNPFQNVLYSMNMLQDISIPLRMYSKLTMTFSFFKKQTFIL